MPRIFNKTLFYYLFLITILPLINAKRTRNEIFVQKCCPSMEYLPQSNNFTACDKNVPDDFSRYTPLILFNRTTLKDFPQNWNITSAFPKCGNEESLTPINTLHFLLRNGSLVLPHAHHPPFHPKQYCFDYKIALACIPSNFDDRTVSECCGNKGEFSLEKNSCVRVNVSENYSINRMLPVLPKKWSWGEGLPECEHGIKIYKNYTEEALQDDGIFVAVGNETVFYNTSCVEHIYEEGGPSPSIFTCHSHLPPTVTIIPTSHQGDLRFTLYPIGLTISAIFLAATLIAGSLLPANHHVLHWRCQTNYVASLLCGYVLLAITQFSMGKLTGTPCFVIAVAMHYLCLSAFFWLNTMCFNIWWTFRDLRPQNLEKSQERCRLRLYSIYAWGVPFLIAAIAATFDLTAEDSSEYSFLRPRFAHTNCWFHGETSGLTYFYGPIGVLLVINLALFAATARELTCGLWKRELVKSTSERAALGRVCMKLVVVMGVTWIADIISIVVGGSQEWWYFTDFINCLQGVFIFIVVSCQPQVLSAVKRVWCWNVRRNAETAGTTNHHSSSSHGLPSMGDSTINNTTVVSNGKSHPVETNC